MKTNKPNKMKVTLEDVLEVTQKGFERVDERFEHLEKDLTGFKSDTKTQLDRIENVLLRKQQNEVERLQDDMRILKTHLKLT